MNDTTLLDTLSAAELFDVLPAGAMRTAELIDSDQVHRCKSLTGEHRDAGKIVNAPTLRTGVTYWVADAIHALVLCRAAPSEAPAAEILSDLELEQYAVMAASSTSSTLE